MNTQRETASREEPLAPPTRPMNGPRSAPPTSPDAGARSTPPTAPPTAPRTGGAAQPRPSSFPAPLTIEEGWQITGRLECLACGYDLQKHMGPVVRCPECGADNDLRDARPWAEKQLPLGVRRRSHWPGEAVGLSFVIPLIAFLTIVVIIGYGWWSLLTVVAFAGLIAAIFGWIRVSRHWLRGCVETTTGLAILILLHLGSWGLFLCLIGWPALASSGSATWPLLHSIGPYGLLTLGVLSLLMYGGATLLIRRGERTGLYRNDPRHYRLPLRMYETRPAIIAPASGPAADAGAGADANPH